MYYRLNVVEINIPPLRERRQDLPDLFAHMMDMYSRKLGKQVNKLSPDVEQLLLNYDYPGNVRELSNIIECGVLLSQNDLIVLSSLPDKVRIQKNSLGIENDVNSLVD